MNLDDGPILARKLDAQKQSDALLQMCDQACPAIAKEFEPFEKYCGALNVSAVLMSQESVQIAVSFAYRMPQGPKLAFTATISRRGDDFILIDRRGCKSIPMTEPGCIALEFLEAITPQAEAAFEAVVLGEPWRLMRILQ